MLTLLFLGLAWASATAQPGAAGLPGRVVDVEAGDYYFRAPDSIPAGIITLRLRTVSGGHGIWLLRLPEGKTTADWIAATREHDLIAWAPNLAGPGFPAVHSTANATYLLLPGRYLIVCFVRDANGIPHAKLGMLHEIIVTPSRATEASVPRAQVTVTLTDYKFNLSKSFSAGPQVVRVVNAGTVGHEFRISRVLPGHTAEEAIKWDPASSAPRVDEDYGGITTLSPGTSLVTTIDFHPGVYLVFCVPQFDHGMYRAITVVAR